MRAWVFLILFWLFLLLLGGCGSELVREQSWVEVYVLSILFFSITLQCNLQDFSVVLVWLDLKSSLGHAESKLKHKK